jgi:hypothetical protein
VEKRKEGKERMGSRLERIPVKTVKTPFKNFSIFPRI